MEGHYDVGKILKTDILTIHRAYKSLDALNKAPVRYLSAVSSLLKAPSKATWNGNKGRFTYRLTPAADTADYACSTPDYREGRALY